MKHANRILAALLALAMMLALGACGTTATTSSTSEAAAASEPQEEAQTSAQEAPEPEEVPEASVEEAASAEEASVQEEEPWVIEYPLFDEVHTYTIWLGTAPDLNDVVSNMDEFVVFNELEKITNVGWDATMVSFMSESEQFQLMVAGGDFTDVVCKAVDNYTGSVDQAIEEEFLIDLAPYIDENMPNLTGWFETYPELRKQITTDNGAIGAFPKFYKEPSDVSSGGMIRADWLEDLGLENPKTFDELHDALVQFQSEKGATKPLVISNSGGVQSELLSGFNISSGYYQTDDVIHFGAIEPAFKDYLTLVHDWYAEGLIDDLFLTNSYDSLVDTSPVLNGTCGAWYGTAAQSITNMLDAAVDPNIRITGLTSVTEDGSVAHVGEEGSLFDTAMWSVTTACEEPEVIAQYIDYIYSEDGILLANYGVEGETFTYVDGTPTLTDLVLNNPDYSYGAALNIFVCDRMTPAPFIIDEARARADYVEDQLNAIEVWNGANDGLYNLPRSGINLTTDESTEYYGLYTDIETYMDEHIIKFIVGDQSLDEFDDYVATLKQMGIEDCIAIEQAAYDRYLAA
jgi:putative aldouronate transport system substrate-binding protein